MKNKLKRVFEWYILGKYHCDKCPYCWSEWSYEGDGDAGCYIFGDLRDSCRLLPPFRTLIGWPKRKRVEYFRAHEYDDFAEWHIAHEKRELCFRKLFLEQVEDCDIYWKDDTREDRKPLDVENDWIIGERLRIMCNVYEGEAHPIVIKSLKQEWKELIKKTWNSFIAVFKPYFCK